jgi:hypothetical protein
MNFDDGIFGLYSRLYENRREIELSLEEYLGMVDEVSELSETESSSFILVSLTSPRETQILLIHVRHRHVVQSTVKRKRSARLLRAFLSNSRIAGTRIAKTFRALMPPSNNIDGKILYFTKICAFTGVIAAIPILLTWMPPLTLFL